MLRKSVRSLVCSPVFYTACMHAFSGAGFAGANLVLAFFLPPVDYAVVALLVALLYLGIPLSVVGLNGAILRRRLDIGPRLLRIAFLTSVAVGTAMLAGGHLIYSLPLGHLLVLPPTIVAGGLTFLSAAKFQSLQKFPISVTLGQSANICLLIAALAAVVLDIRQPQFLLLVMLACYGVTAAWSWTVLLSRHAAPADPQGAIPWREALLYAIVTGAGILLLQMERLLTPTLLGLEQLAVFGVVGAVIIAPFRSLEMAVGFTLLPRLRAASGPGERRRLLAQEAKLVGLLVLGGSVATWYLAPLIIDWLLADKYAITPAVFLAAIVGGAIKVVSTAARASVTALCNTRELGYLSVLLWLSVGCAVAGAAIGANWGLVGLIYGVAFGWVCRGLAAAYLAAPYFRDASEPPPREPEVAER